jgi:glutamyl-tRNA synthetase
MDKSLIRKLALANAVKYGGKANPGAVVGGVIANHPDAKNDMKTLSKEIAAVIKEVNAMKPDAQLAELQKTAPELLAPKPKEEKTRELPRLEGMEKGKVVTRFPPEPSKTMHLGHVCAALLNYLEAKEHDGKFILRWEETNPEKSTQETLDFMREDFKWLGMVADKEVYASDYMDAYYEKAERLIKQKDAYVCFCDQDTMRDLRFKSIACACRDASVDQNLDNWRKMIDGTHREGKCVLRFVGDMQNPNGTLRDPVIMRIVEAPHFRHGTKYKVWPMYDFESPIAEDINGVTHIFRSAEFDQRIDLQNLIKQKLDLRTQEVLQFGRINVIGSITQGREIREKVQSGEYLGWDDPRLVTVAALRRRGIRPEALKELIYELGWDKGQVRLDYSIVAAISRKLVDGKTDRLFFLPNPISVRIEGAPSQTVELHRHPDHPERGQRIMKTGTEFLLPEDDFNKLEEGRLYRMMECLNFRKEGQKLVFDSKDVESYRKKSGGIMHWLPAEGNLKADIMMPDATTLHGVVEPGAKELKVDDVIQFERFGFCRLDRVEKDTHHFWFTNK